MGLFNIVTVAKVTNTVMEKSEEGFFLTAGAVRKGARICFVFQTCAWDDTRVEESLNDIFEDTKRPTVYSFPTPTNGDYSNN